MQRLKPRCPQCRTRRATYASLLDHVKASGHRLCLCGGYPYKHRPDSPCCVENTYVALNEYRRRTENPDKELEFDLWLEGSLFGSHKPDPVNSICPF